MKRIPVKLDSSAALAVVSSVAPPLAMTCTNIRYRADRARAAHADRDKGALSIEMALLIVALVAAAVVIFAAIKALVGKQSTQIGKTDITK